VTAGELLAREAPANAGELLARVEAAGLEQVRIAWADLHGSYRSKTVVVGGPFGTRALASALKQGVGMVSTLLLKDSADRTALPVFEPGALAGLAGFGAANNLLLWPDPASFVELPWAPRTGWLRATPRWSDGSSVEADPRSVLQRALARLAEAGYTLRVGLEVEFHVYRLDAAPLPRGANHVAVAADAGRVYAMGGFIEQNRRCDDKAFAYEVKEVVDAVNLDAGTPIRQLKVDGGACNNDFLMQFQADVLGIPIERPQVLDVTAQGAAFAAGLAVGFWDDYRALVEGRPIDRVFEPGGGQGQAQANFSQWQRAVERAKGWAD
jgi:hypothetical protein